MTLRTACRGVSLLALIFSMAGCSGRTAGRASAAFDPDSIPEAYRNSTAALMWPGATRAFQVTSGGDLYNGEWRVRIAPSGGSGLADAPRAIAFEERWLPVAHWRRRSGALRWDFEATALPETETPRARVTPASDPAPRDSGLIVTLNVTVTNSGSAPAEARLDLTLEEGDSLAAFLAFDAPESTIAPYRWSTGSSASSAEGWASIPTTSGTASVRWTLPAGASQSARFALPAYSTPDRTLARWARRSHEERADQARRFWNDEMERSSRFELGDPGVERALRAALVVLLSCREHRGPKWVPIGGPLHYRDVWLRDGARVVAALAVMGRGAEARELADGLSDYQWPNGAFISQRGQLDGTGQALWAFEQALLRPSPSDSLARFAQAAFSAWKWMEWQRDLGRSTGWPYGSMLPYADPHDNELVRAQLVGTDAWAIAGYRSTARLLAASGLAAEADTVERSRARYVDEFKTALARNGSADLPPSWQGPGRDWGNLTIASPCAVLSPFDPRCEQLARRVWSESGGAGLASYSHQDSAHYYLGADLATWGLLTGRRSEADSVLTAMLHWRSASGGAAEVFSRSSRDYGTNPPPHTTSAATLLALVRNALLYDDADTLMLTLGARAEWWRAGRVHGAPTRWGNLDLSFHRRGAEAEWTWNAVPVWTALTLPPGTRLAQSPEGPLVRGRTDSIVLAPPGTRSARVSIVDSNPGTP